MSYPVKWFDSTMGGAPVLSGTAGAMIALLDACLVNGFNVLTPTSITVSGGIATVVYSTTHGYLQHQVIAVSGATPAELNGEKRVLSVVDINTLTFDATGIADATATGTISTKAAPLGWEKVFSGTNKAVYRSTDVTSTRLDLRVDDTGTKNALARGYEAMTDVDTGTGPFPTAAQMTDGWYWRKSNTANSAARRWRLFGDAFLFHLFPRWDSDTSYGAAWYRFGDAITFKAGDAYHCIIGGHNKASPSYTGHFPSMAECYSYNDKYHFARSHTQTGEAKPGRECGSRACDNFGYLGAVYPSAVDNGLHLHYPVLLTEGDNISEKRGILPGVLQPIQNAPLTDGAIVTDLPDLPGLVVMLVCIDYSRAEARIAIDITGPWR